MTHRERFSQMPPLANNWKQPEQSKVLQYIQAQLGCDLRQAQNVFQHLRKARIVVFVQPIYRWQGCRYVREVTQDEINADLMARTRQLEHDLRASQRLVADLEKRYLSHLDSLHPGS